MSTRDESKSAQFCVRLEWRPASDAAARLAKAFALILRAAQSSEINVVRNEPAGAERSTPSGVDKRVRTTPPGRSNRVRNRMGPRPYHAGTKRNDRSGPVPRLDQEREG